MAATTTTKEEWLSKLTAGLLVYDKRYIVSVGEGETVEQALSIMQVHGITSIVVRSADGKEYTGIVTALDIAVYIAATVEKDELYNANVPNLCKLPSLTKPIKDLIGLTEESQSVWQVENSTTLDKVIDMMSKGVHRILVHGEDETEKHAEEFRLLTQSNMIVFLREFARQVPDLVELSNSSIKDAGLISCTKKLHTVCGNAKAIDAFRSMKDHGIPALPIVDEKGAVVGAISASDLRGLRTTKLQELFEPVMSFLHKRRAVHYPVCVRHDCTVGEVLNSVIAHRVHRVWVTDDDMKLVGVISLSDLVTKFSPYDWLKSGN